MSLLGGVAKAVKRSFRPDISIFHEFVKPPYGGGNQFALALRGEMERRGFAVEANRISKSSRVCLFNSFNFDFAKLEAFKAARPGCRMIHRVDGPISVYRGRDDGTDERIRDINEKLADATVFQSRYSLEKHRELGLLLKNPVIITNACDPFIFNRIGKDDSARGGKIKIVSSSWSDNPNKGGDVYKWLDGNLDFSRYEYTFVGRVKASFRNINMAGSVGSRELADILKSHHIYLTASRNEPCSNALIEALSCGLPAVYLKSGSHPEVVKDGGEGFSSNDEALAAINKVSADLAGYATRIKVAGIPEVADQYLSVMGLGNS